MAGFLKSLFGGGSAPEISPVQEPVQPPSNAAPIEVADGTFAEQVLAAGMPVLVDFWASWCGPCRMMAPIIDELAVEYDGRVVMARLNTDENFKVAGQFDISRIPTQVIFEDGQEVGRHAGFATRHELLERLDSALGLNKAMT